MSNLSQFFATGGNKIKKIQRVQASQVFSGSNWEWSGVSASIASVDPNKTIVVYNTMASNFVRSTDATNNIRTASIFGHYAYLSSATQVAFDGPIVLNTSSFGFSYNSQAARIEVQIIEFE